MKQEIEKFRKETGVNLVVKEKTVSLFMVALFTYVAQALQERSKLTRNFLLKQ